MRMMFSGEGKTRSPFGGLVSRGALALPLVLALFVCDGAFGAVLHQLTPSVYAGEAPVGTPLFTEGYALQAAHAWG
jgi:hypothetical protein